MRSSDLNLPFGSNRFTSALKPADHPLFYNLCQAARRGDVETVKHLVFDQATPFNARDQWDATPLYYACLCGHLDCVKLLLEAGAIADPSTFEGERCAYGALTDDIRRELRNNAFSIATSDERADYAILFLGLYNARAQDVTFTIASDGFTEHSAHRFILVARCPYFAKQLLMRWPPDEKETRIVIKNRRVHPLLFAATLKWIYTAICSDGTEIPQELYDDWILIAKTWKLHGLVKEIQDLQREMDPMRLVPRLNKRAPLLTTQIDKIQDSMLVLATCLVQFGNDWLQWIEQGMPELNLDNVASKVGTRDYAILFKYLTDCITNKTNVDEMTCLGILLTHASKPDIVLTIHSGDESWNFPAHKALICQRCEYFSLLLQGEFLEASAQQVPLHAIHNPGVFAICLEYLYTDRITMVDEMCPDNDDVHELIQASDVLLLDRLKNQVVQYIIKSPRNKWQRMDLLKFLDASVQFHMPRLEGWTTKEIAHDLEAFLEPGFFEELLARINESIEWVREREREDSIPLIDDLRYYLSTRFQIEDFAMLSTELPMGLVGDVWASDEADIKDMIGRREAFARLMTRLDQMVGMVGGKVVDRMELEMLNE
jgi:ankyrin repeat/BTB/POZ domain-containing protein 1